jgi:AraC-like DNA-binding protein
MIQVREGAAYWLNSQQNLELCLGAVLLLRPRIEGTILASQLGGALLNVFHVEPQRLTGLITLYEQRLFETAASRTGSTPPFMPPQSAVASKLSELCANSNRNALAFRLQLLQLFFEAFGNELKQDVSEPTPQTDAKERLRKLLDQIPASEMLEMRFSELVRKAMCTPRHLNRIFHEVIGSSFRDKQTEIRLQRASELLATTESKVLDVAMESGYQSVSLFNLLFKRRFGVTPAIWREKIRGRHIPGRRTGKRLTFRA